MFTHLPRPIVEELAVETQKTGNRYYVTPAGRRYPSVTTVLKLHGRDGIAAWRKRVGDAEAARIGAQAGARGNRIHTLIEKYLNNEPVSPNIFDLEMFLSMKRHLNRINNIRVQEVGLYSDYLRMAGRCDCVAEFDGKLSIIDFKSSLRTKAVDHIHGYCMQTAGYATMYEELYGVAITQGVVIIGVDNDKPQVFKVGTQDWLLPLIELRDQWERENKIKAA